MHQRTKIAVAVAMATSSMAAFAQTAEPSLQRVEVTGSRIRAVDLETAQPVQVMSQEAIQKSGLVTVGDILNNLTSAAPPAFSKGSVLTSNREQGGQYIDMRNLGANRLLVLVNGKRWTQTVAGFTDLSTIPSAMIEKIEILKDGASSIYGSDAIAGVVNIILKKTLEGGTASVYVGQNEKGDGETTDASLTYGTSTDKASLMFGLSFSEQKAVFAKDREITSYSYGPNHKLTGLVGGPWGRIQPVNPTTGNAGAGFHNYLNHTGGFMGDGVGADARNPANYHPYLVGGQPRSDGADQFNASSQMMFQSPTRLASMFTKGSIELPYDIRFTTTALFAERNSSAQVAGFPLSSSSQANYKVYVDKNSYYNPYGNSVAGAGLGQDIFFSRRTIEQPRVTYNKNRTVHVDGGFEGDMKFGEKAWNWSTGFNYSSSNGNVKSTGNINLVNLKAALGPSFLNSSGQVQCGTATAPIGFATCTPFNILGGPSASTPQAINFIMSTGQATYSSTVKSLTADVAGELFTLPGGQLGMAAGVEHRTVSGNDIPGQFEQSGLSTNLAGNATYGKYTVKEAYAELQIPVLKGMPLAELLSFNIATRYSDYSNFGDTTNSKISFMWKPVKDLLTRGTYAQGFRAPSLGDTFGGGSQSFDSYIDPCDTVVGEAAPSKNNPTVQARCLAAGVPAGFRQTNAAGAFVGAGGAQTTVAFNTGAGNDSLTPETATTKTLGLVYSPSFIPGASMSLDWFNIAVKNRITGISATYTVNQCFIFGVQSFCDKFKRDTTGKIVALSRGNANLGELRTEGVDIGVKYRMKRTAYGQFNIASETTYVDSYGIKSTATGNFVELAGDFGTPRVKSNLVVDWSMANWSATFGTRYTSKVKTSCWSSTEECNTPGGTWSGGTDYDVKSALVYNDLSVGYAFPWKGKLLIGANNVFDKKPRIVYDANGNFGGNSASSSVDPDINLDRFIYVRYNQSF